MSKPIYRRFRRIFITTRRLRNKTILRYRGFAIMTQPKLTDLDYPFCVAPMSLYVSHLRPRLNFGSVSLSQHRPRLTQLPHQLSHVSIFYLLSLPNRYGPRKRLPEVLSNFMRTASPDGRLRVTLEIQVSKNGPLKESSSMELEILRECLFVQQSVELYPL